MDRHLKKHPHVRGEDSRARRPGERLPGNTPTCVGKTQDAGAVPVVPAETPPRAWGRQRSKQLEPYKGRKHPHVRGEDRQHEYRDVVPCGNTPTCVGKTKDRPNMITEF